MALTQLAAQFKTLSLAMKFGIGAGVLVLLVAIGGAVHWWNGRTIASLNKEQTALKSQLQQKVDAYNQLLGEAHAHELAAREDKAKSDAMRAEYEKRIGNVKALDSKLAQVETNFEKAKAELGDCGDTEAECLKKTCLDLQKAGFKVTCE